MVPALPPRAYFPPDIVRGVAGGEINLSKKVEVHTYKVWFFFFLLCCEDMRKKTPLFIDFSHFGVLFSFCSPSTFVSASLLIQPQTSSKCCSETSSDPAWGSSGVLCQDWQRLMPFGLKMLYSLVWWQKKGGNHMQRCDRVSETKRFF